MYSRYSSPRGMLTMKGRETEISTVGRTVKFSAVLFALDSNFLCVPRSRKAKIFLFIKEFFTIFEVCGCHLLLTFVTKNYLIPF